jgi:1,4-dihydroxy-6-naphthoate synthase
MLFSDVVAAVTSGRCGAGLLIHEAQLNFADAGLRPIADLGAAWKTRTGLPLPLGLNVVRRDLDARFGTGSEKEVAVLLESSVRHCRTHTDASRRFLRLHASGGPDGLGAREEWADDALLDRYMAMYVNDDTEDMGRRGEQALARLYADAHAAGLCPDPGPIDVLRASS